MQKLIARHEHAHLRGPLFRVVGRIGGKEGLGALNLGGSWRSLEQDAPDFSDAGVVSWQLGELVRLADEPAGLGVRVPVVAMADGEASTGRQKAQVPTKATLPLNSGCSATAACAFMSERAMLGRKLMRLRNYFPSAAAFFASSGPMSRTNTLRQRISPPWVWSMRGPLAGSGCFLSQ